MVSIALCGAGGVGKGTLGSYLAHELGYYFLPSAIKDIGQRICPQAREFNEIPLREKYAYQYSILTAQMEKEFLLKDLNINFVSERSAIDYLPYFIKAFGEDTAAVDQYKEMIISHVRKMAYDYLIYLPVEFRPTKEDITINAWKERDAQSQAHTDSVIFEQFRNIADSKLSVTLMPSGSIEERIAECCSRIKL